LLHLGHNAVFLLGFCNSTENGDFAIGDERIFLVMVLDAAEWQRFTKKRVPAAMINGINENYCHPFRGHGCHCFFL